MEPYQQKVSKLRQLNSGTLGKEIAKCLDNHNLTELRTRLLKPKLEQKTRFDLKQVTKLGAFASITALIFAMIFCLPFLFYRILLI